MGQAIVLSQQVALSAPQQLSGHGCRSRASFDMSPRMYVGRIVIFPIKSLDGVEVDQVTITTGGILENDRAYAIFDEKGCVVNGKRTVRIHQLRCEFDPSQKEVRLWENASPVQFCLDTPDPMDRWLSDFFGFPVALKHEPTGGFPDDRAAFGPTIVGEASLRAVQEWYPQLSVDSLRRRFRANLELTGDEAFCEDHLYGAPDELKPFRVGDIGFLGHNPCQRCVVPTRDPGTGDPVAGFQKKFMEMRRQALPEWANANRFNHFYRFAVNTSIPPSEAGKILRKGDRVSV